MMAIVFFFGYYIGLKSSRQTEQRSFFEAKTDLPVSTKLSLRARDVPELSEASFRSKGERKLRRNRQTRQELKSNAYKLIYQASTKARKAIQGLDLEQRKKLSIRTATGTVYMVQPGLGGFIGVNPEKVRDRARLVYEIRNKEWTTNRGEREECDLVSATCSLGNLCVYNSKLMKKVCEPAESFELSASATGENAESAIQMTYSDSGWSFSSSASSSRNGSAKTSASLTSSTGSAPEMGSDQSPGSAPKMSSTQYSYNVPVDSSRRREIRRRLYGNH